MTGIFAIILVVVTVGGLLSLLSKDAREDKEHVAMVKKNTTGCLGFFFVAAVAIITLIIFAMATGFH